MQFGMPWPGAAVGREAEERGVAAFCTGDFAHNDAYVSLAQMVAATTTAQVGTGIAYAFSRTPYAHAAAVRSLAPKAGERMFLGLGSGAFKINRDWLGVDASRPVARMAELVPAIRAFLHAENGTQIRYQGEFFDLTADIRAPVMGRLDIPILLGAFNTQMAQVAGRVADGVIGHGLFTQQWWDDVVRPSLATGSTDGVRPIEHGWVITAINDAEPERAIHDARMMVAFYLTVKTYDAYVEAHGWQPQTEQLRAAFGRGDLPAMAAAVTDDMLAAIALCGSTADALVTLKERAAHGGLPKDTAFFSPPSFMVSPRRIEGYTRSSLGLVDSVTQLG